MNASFWCDHQLPGKEGIPEFSRGENVKSTYIAPQLALAVMYPETSHIATGGLMVHHVKKGKSSLTDSGKNAPAKLNRLCTTGRGKRDADI